jgi:alpha-aminoadipic semialdehyde synthase
MNNNVIGIRREDKNQWERRTPIIPAHVGSMTGKLGAKVLVQPSIIRVFGDGEYREAGAVLDETLSGASVIFGVKEIPLHLLQAGKTYVFFSHTVKGQALNMPMLRRLMELRCNLIDYEKIVDESGKRLVFFGRHAGLAGMIDSLWALGRRLEWEGISTPFAGLRQAYGYRDLKDAMEAVSAVGEMIRRDGLPEGLGSCSFAFTGYGNVSRGAQEIFDLLPFREVAPGELAASQGRWEKHFVFKTVFREADMVVPDRVGDSFDLGDYYNSPEGYRSIFHGYLEHITVLINGIYWEQKYPRLVTKNHLRSLFERHSSPRLRLIGDISCDVEGSIECTLKATTPDHPVFVFDPLTGNKNDGWSGRGVVVLAVDNLPCELPLDSSTHFSQALEPFFPAIITEDFSAGLDESRLPPELKGATILRLGQLTPSFRYLEKHLASHLV